MRLFHHALLLQTRLELNLTQEQAAAAVGTDVRTYRRYESGAVNDPRQGFSVRHPTRRRMLERLATEFGLTQDQLLVDPASPPPVPPAAPPEEGWRPHCVHTLQRARHFVGRRELLTFLTEWTRAARPAEHVVALVALGGTGKTAVAERLVTLLGEAPRPGGVFVWSFYEDPRAEGFLAQALRYFSRGDEVAPGERLERLQAVLGAGPPHLLVLDGLEEVQSLGAEGLAHGELQDPALRRLLAALARGLGGARALVTSRFPLANLEAWESSGLRTLLLETLPEPEALELLRHWGLHGDVTALRALVEHTGGHALSVSMLGSYVGTFLDGDASRFEEPPLAEAARDERLARRLQAVLAAYARALTPRERDLLARLCVLAGGVDEEALLHLARTGGALAGSLAGVGPAELRRALKRLERLGLVFTVHAGRAIYSTHPFVRGYFQSWVGVAPEQLHALERERLAARLDTHGLGLPREEARLDALEALLRHTLRSGQAAAAFSLYERSLGGFAHLGLRLGEMSRGARLTALFAEQGDPRRQPASLSVQVRSELAYDWGLYTGALGDLAFAVRCQQTAVELLLPQGDSTALTTALRTLGYNERLRGRLTEARDLLTRALSMALALEDRSHTARTTALLGMVLHDLGDSAAADEHFARARHLDAAPMARRALWEAEHDLALGRSGKALESTRRNLAACQGVGWSGHVAHCHTVLGLLAVHEDPQAAREHLRQAWGWARASNEVEMRLRCHELAAHVALQSGQLDEARREAETGLGLATMCGFGLFRGRLASLRARVALAHAPREAAAEGLAALEATPPEDAWGRAEALQVASETLASGGEHARARELQREARALKKRLLFSI